MARGGWKGPWSPKPRLSHNQNIHTGRGVEGELRRPKVEYSQQRPKASSLMDLSYRELSRQEVKCQALPPGRQKGTAESMLMAWDAPNANLGTDKKTPHQAMSKWQLLGQSEFPQHGKVRSPHLLSMVQHCSLDVRQNTLHLREQAFAMNCWPWQTLTRMPEKKAQSKTIHSLPHLPHLERVLSQKWNHVKVDVLGLLTIFTQPWSTP